MSVVFSEEADRALSEVAQIFSHRRFKESLDYLHNVCGIPITRIADVSGASRRCLYFWANGEHTPRNPYPMVVVNIWATKKREGSQRNIPDTVSG